MPATASASFPGERTKSMAKNKKKGQTIKRNEKTSQLLERGEGPTAEEQIDPSVDGPSEITIEGGPGGDGGFSTLGGGVYPDEGSEDDAPSYGDWQRHSS